MQKEEKEKGPNAKEQDQIEVFKSLAPSRMEAGLALLSLTPTASPPPAAAAARPGVAVHHQDQLHQLPRELLLVDHYSARAEDDAARRSSSPTPCC